MSYNRYSPDIHEDGSGHFYCRFEELSAEFQAEIANIMTNHTNSIYTGTDLNGTGSSISYNIPTSVGGDLYVNVETWNVYKATATSVWDYVGNIKGEKGDEGPRGSFYGTCSTTGEIEEKAVSCDGFELKKGNIIVVTFTYENTQDNIKLNVNSTGAKNVIIGSYGLSANNPIKWSGPVTIAFIYNGATYSFLTATNASVNQSKPVRGANSWFGSCTTSGNVAKKEVSGIRTFIPFAGAIVTIAFAYRNIADELTLNIDGTGDKAIYLGNAATSSSNKLEWDAGDRIMFVYSGSYYYFLCKSKDLTKVSDLTNDLNFIDASGAPVQSVNGQTGDVVLDADDVGALPDDTVIPTDTADLTNSAGYITSSDIPVTSVNSQTGDVSLDASDVGALPDTTSIPSSTSDLVNDSGFITSSDIPVTSVNSQTGDVVLDATDVGALPDDTSIPANTSDLNNDSGFITSSDIPVTSVNSQTGDITLDADDVGALPDDTFIPTDTADLTNSAGFITGYTEVDPIYSASAASGITSSDISNWNGKTSNTGTVTSVQVQATSPVVSSSDTAQSTTLNTTISLANGYGDTKNPYGSKTANQVLAAPNGSNGTPSFRSLAKADLPTLTASDVGALPDDTVIPTQKVWYGSCSTISDTAAKVINTSTGDFSGEHGAVIIIKFDNSTFKNLNTFNVDGTGDYVAYDGSGTASGSSWASGDILAFVLHESGGTKTYRKIDTPRASLTNYGVVMLNNSTSSSSTEYAATPSAVKAVKDSIPTKVSDLQNDSGFITGYTETDPIYSASAASGITSSDISNWNGKADTSDIPTDVSELNNDSGYITTSDIPTDVSDFNNDAGYVIGSGTAKIYVSSSTPSSPSEGDIWIDTSSL